MNFDLYFIYLIVAFSVIVTPGPNVFFIVSQSINLGIKEGLTSIAGTSLAMAIQLFIAGLGISSVLIFISEWFIFIKWMGVIYLVYLGIKLLLEKPKQKQEVNDGKSYSLLKGFIVSATNPKQVIFFAAFIPQFIDPAYSIGFQVFILSVTYFIIALISDIGYAYFASKISQSLPTKTSLLNKISGGLLLGAAMLLGSLELSSQNKK